MYVVLTSSLVVFLTFLVSNTMLSFHRLAFSLNFNPHR